MSNPVISYNEITAFAREVGFDECGISPAGQLEDHALHMESWLAKGFQGSMSYLERNRQKRYNPSLLVEGAQSVISVLLNYFPAEQLTENNSYQISKYAYGGDYHQLIREKLRKLLMMITEKTGPLTARVFTDSAPVLDRAWAQKSGLGFIGKNTCLIHPRKGSFFFIGHIISSLEVQSPTVEITDYCGTCRRCIDACPTAALVDAHVLDARRCISYLTIENKGELPAELKPAFGNWIFGCDICQDVCPWNRYARPHNEPAFLPINRLRNMNKDDWEGLDEQLFDELFTGSAMQRTGFKGLKRNIDFLKK
jgi:epoxyqueuosine reductase